MWNLLVIAVLASMAGMYTNVSEQALFSIERNNAKELAESMGLYREAVIRYYTVHDLKDHSIGLEAMKTENMVPPWSRLHTHSDESIWGNYRAADGTIYVYATALPSMNIQVELARLSRNSYLVGMYRTSGNILFSPVYGDTGISLSALASKSVPDHAPVWIGHRR